MFSCDRTMQDAGACVKAVNAAGDTPLMFACGAGHIGVTARLLQVDNVTSAYRKHAGKLHLQCRHRVHQLGNFAADTWITDHRNIASVKHLHHTVHEQHHTGTTCIALTCAWCTCIYIRIVLGHNECECRRGQRST
jgi:hypothetical protein